MNVMKGARLGISESMPYTEVVWCGDRWRQNVVVRLKLLSGRACRLQYICR